MLTSRCGCDPDFYLRPSNPRVKPHGWKRAVQCAGIVHIDEMRTLLVARGRRAGQVRMCLACAIRWLAWGCDIRVSPAASELHYDAVFTERYLKTCVGRDGEERKATRRRKSDFKVFKSVANAHKRKLCQRIELPHEIKNLLRSPKDEDNWAVLRNVRREIVLLTQGLLPRAGVLGGKPPRRGGA